MSQSIVNFAHSAVSLRQYWFCNSLMTALSLHMRRVYYYVEKKQVLLTREIKKKDKRLNFSRLSSNCGA